MKILIDNGHGLETVGKASPDGKYKEWAWSREMAQMIVDELTTRGYDARRLVTEAADVALSERVARVNSLCRLYGAGNVIVVSIHSNANSSDGQWHDGQWSGFVAEVAPNASVSSRRLADKIWRRAIVAGLRGNRSFSDKDGERYLVQNLAICRDTLCPAVLTESAFHDTHEGVALLTSAESKRRIMQAHVEGIVDFLASK